MYDRILAMLDGSDLAEVVIPYAEELSRHLGSEIILASVLWVAPKSALEIIFESGREQEYSDLMALPLGQYLQNVPIQAKHVQRILLTGMPDEQILGFADNNRVGLVLLASHGESGIKPLVFGSVCDKVVRTAKVPVFVVKSKCGDQRCEANSRLRKVLVPLDGSQTSEAILPHVDELAVKLNAGVTLLHVITKGYHTIAATGYKWAIYPEQQMESDRASAMIYLNNVATGFREKGIAVTSQVKFGDSAEEIVTSSAEMSADLVAMSSHGSGGFPRWALGSVADKVIRATDAPVLLVKPVPVQQDYADRYIRSTPDNTSPRPWC